MCENVDPKSLAAMSASMSAAKSVTGGPTQRTCFFKEIKRYDHAEHINVILKKKLQKL